jgi:hypothetical protein
MYAAGGTFGGQRSAEAPAASTGSAAADFAGINGAGAGGEGGVASGECAEVDTVLPSTDERQQVYACRKCRFLLFTQEHVTAHAKEQQTFSYRERAKGVDDRCTSFFLEDAMEWMGEAMGGGKIVCPNCSTRLGQLKWAGAQCSCGSWITPAVQVSKSKLDLRLRVPEKRVEISTLAELKDAGDALSELSLQPGAGAGAGEGEGEGGGAAADEEGEGRGEEGEGGGESKGGASGGASGVLAAAAASTSTSAAAPEAAAGERTFNCADGTPMAHSVLIPKVKSLVSMGFDRSLSRRAILKFNGDAGAALGWICSADALSTAEKGYSEKSGYS